MNYLLVVQVFVRTPSWGLVGHFCVEINNIRPKPFNLMQRYWNPGFNISSTSYLSLLQRRAPGVPRPDQR